MKHVISENKNELGAKAAKQGAEVIRKAIKARGQANIIVATGASQFETLEHLVKEPNIDWTKVVAFHLDEYVKMPITHKASFRAYLWNRFVKLLPLPLKMFYYINGEDPKTEIKRLNKIIKEHPIDVAFVGIGENAHLAFNDPPADFKIKDPYLVVKLDADCRKQQFGEGWFKTMSHVPKEAVSMSIQHILKSKTIIAAVPDNRKAQAVKGALEGPVTPNCPSSIMQQHKDTTVYLDRDSASLLSKKSK